MNRVWGKAIGTVFGHRYTLRTYIKIVIHISTAIKTNVFCFVRETDSPKDVAMATFKYVLVAMAMLVVHSSDAAPVKWSEEFRKHLEEIENLMDNILPSLSEIHGEFLE